MGHWGRKRVIVGLQGTEQSEPCDFYNLSRESVKNYEHPPFYPQQLRIVIIPLFNVKPSNNHNNHHNHNCNLV